MELSLNVGGFPALWCGFLGLGVCCLFGNMSNSNECFTIHTSYLI